ncbi:MAG: pantoate--beta-alanine ligase [Proteobacteria bacterium]|nr:pantoate--beta-alanine ligase [Pseudomonadota bacterium]MBU1715201.1 pantoate--beta-alanine ligase [Pseudomonadota bacterium]
MEVIRSLPRMTEWSDQMVRAGRSIAFVPTMGYFHEGHLSLMRMARKQAECVVVSLFVNPIQFGPAEDLSHYPRDFERDKAMAAREGIDVLFSPEVKEMYPEGALSKVTVDKLGLTLCGASRPGHFDGVTTVVAKLFNLVRPQCAVFGSKDFQQLAIIRRMVKDLNWGIDILAHPIVREDDGLAMSSRNTYLDKYSRPSALCLYNAIKMARKRVMAGFSEAEKLVIELRELILSYGNVEIEYIDIVDRDDLMTQDKINAESFLVMAVKVGNTRLIDNDHLGILLGNIVTRI